MLTRNLLLRSGRSVFARAHVRHARRFVTTDRPTSSSADLETGQPAAARLSPQERYALSGEVAVEGGAPAPTAAVDEPAESWDEVVQKYTALEHQKNATGHLGSELEPHYQPEELLTNPPKPSEVTLELLLASQAHLGHATSLWNPGNSQYIFGVRDGTHIISLDVTAAHLRRAAKVVQGVAHHGGLILFVGTRKGQDTCVVRAAQLAGGCHLFERWRPGSITNGESLLRKCGTKVVNERDEEVQGFDEQLEKRASLKPDLVVCLNPMENYVLLHECALNNIPTIGVIDTNANPTWVTYPIPANDDSLRCVQVIAGVLGRAGEAGHKERLQQAMLGRVTYAPAQGLKIERPPNPRRSSSGQARELVPDVVVR